MKIWQAGDIAQIFRIPDRHPLSKFNGEIVSILSSPLYDFGGMFTYVQISRIGLYTRCDVALLRPIYDGNDKVSWDDCIWKPQKVVVPVDPGQSFYDREFDGGGI